MRELLYRPTEEESMRFQSRVAELLARQIALYTANASTSVPLELAQELLAGILFCLRAEERGGGLWALDPEEAFARGRDEVRRRMGRAEKLWEHVAQTLPFSENRSLCDTVRSIGQGFGRCDVRFFAHRFDCEIDYQLAVPAPEELQGIDYVYQYLIRLAAENALLNRLDRDAVRCVLERSCPDWHGLLVNLYAPAAGNALARAVLCGGAGTPELSDNEVELLQRRWEHYTPDRITEELTAAAQVLTRALDASRLETTYLTEYAREIAVRAAALRDCGGLRGLFA